MQCELERIAGRLRSHREKSGSDRPRFPEDLRREVASVASRAVSAGWPRSRITKVLGISIPTLVRWFELTDVAWRSVSVVREDELQEDRRQRTEVRVVSPSGWAIEGVDVATAVEIVTSQR